MTALTGKEPPQRNIKFFWESGGEKNMGAGRGIPPSRDVLKGRNRRQRLQWNLTPGENERRRLVKGV